MKKVLFAAIAVTGLLFVSSCAKDRVDGCTDPFSINYNPAATDEDGSCFAPSSEKHALVGDFTGTWCPWCGEWGGPEFDAGIEAAGSKCVPIGIHVTDEMTTSVSSDFDSYYGAEGIVTGYPTLYVWNQAAFTSGSAIASAVDLEVQEKAVAGAVAAFTVNGTKLEIQVSAQLFDNVDGDYYVAAYVMENGLNYTQQIESSGPDATWIHDHVIRTSSNGSVWGEQFIFGTGQNGQTFNKTYEVDNNDAWKTENMYCIAIIWKHDPDTDKYTFVNVQSTEVE